MAKVSAEDVAYLIGLSADELSKPCDSNIIPSLADCFSQWKVIFGSLLSDLDLSDVDKESSTEEEKRIAALRKWKARNGCEATYKVLVDALLNRGERYQAENLCKILAHHLMSDKNGTTTTDCDAKESESDILFQCPCGECSLETYLQEGCPKSCIPYLGMTTLSKEDRENLNFILKKDTKKIIRSFENLSNGICDSLKRQEVTVDNLVRVAVHSDSSLHDKLIKSTSIDRVFTDLAPEMSFFNHETLTRIINVLGDGDDKEHLAYYSKEFQEFCKRKVFEIEPGPCTCGQYLSNLKQRKPFAVVLPTGEKRVQNLGDAISIKETLADVLGVPLATLHLHRIDRGSIILVFSVPDSIAQELFPLPKEKLALLRAKGMVLFVPQDFTYESNQVKEATKPLACSGDMHEASSEHPPVVASDTPGELLVSHSLPTSAMTKTGAGPQICISSTTPQEDVGYDQRTLEAKDYREYLYVQQKGIGAESTIFDTTRKRMWVEMSLAPTSRDNFLAFYKNEEEWMQDRALGVKIPLETEVSVKKAHTTYISGKHVLQLIFVSYSKQVDLAFESMTKMDQWYEALTRYYHVELIRCHEFPHIEGEYVIEVCRDHSSYKVWPVDRAKLGWKWKFSDIERCIWHPSGTKLEVECQRSSKGAGHVFFVGRHALRLYNEMKTRPLQREVNDYARPKDIYN